MERQQVFQRLKPACIQLLQVTARLAQHPAARKDLSPALTDLLAIIQSITVQPGLLDPKLAEYAFVPISQVLRLSRQVPVRALELCLECIALLLDQAWGGNLEPALSAQLLILFTFLAKPSSAENGVPATSEELQSLAFTCIASLLNTASRIPQGKQAIIAIDNVPLLAEAVLVMLDSLVDSRSTEVRLRAISALSALNDSIPDDDALASFLPRMVSSLTKVLTPSTSNRPNFRIIEQSIDVLSTLLLRLLSDQNTGDLPQTSSLDLSRNHNTVPRSRSWLQATATQIKIALASILKLRDHDKSEVRGALLKLCLRIVRDCRASLSSCISMSIEAMVSLVSQHDHWSSVEDEVKMLLSADQTLASLLRESLYGWVVSLPRMMQSKDNHARRRIIHQISATLRLFDQRLTTIDEKLANSLRDGISAVFSESKGLEELNGGKHDTLSSQALITGSSNFIDFRPLKFQFKAQEDAMSEFRILIKELARSDAALAVAQELSTSIDAGPLEGRFASLWISVQIIKCMSADGASFSDIIDLGTPAVQDALLDDLYCHALAILDQKASTTDLPWQYLALTLEIVAFQAQRFRYEFRAELSEVLYTVLQYLGHPNVALQEHALVCLNIISTALEYSSIKELVVDNVDYIVNAVGLKFAFGDVSPQGPQVLLMMLRLCGPSLLPYLDDLIGNIFDVLERYHGYPKLAELLFSVLKGILEEGIRLPEFTLYSDDQGHRNEDSSKKLTMMKMVQHLKNANNRSQNKYPDYEELKQEDVPQKPWKDNLTKSTEDPTELVAGKQTLSTSEAADTPPPAPRIFNMFLKISELTQHYLTAGSPRLRSSLLSLLNTSIPTLSMHESSFLPLINTLWPVLLPRLQDPEAYVVSNAMLTIALMCKHARSFMSTRIEGAWDLILKIYRRTGFPAFNQYQDYDRKPISLEVFAGVSNMTELSIYDSSDSTLYVDTPSRMLWKSLLNLLCVIARNVPMHEERFEEILDMLAPVLEQHNVHEALQHTNADALWLRLYKQSKQRSDKGYVKQTGSFDQPHVATKTPLGKPCWQFVSL